MVSLQRSEDRCCWVASVVSDSARPHRWEPTRLPLPWDSPSKNTITNQLKIGSGLTSIKVCLGHTLGSWGVPSIHWPIAAKWPWIWRMFPGHSILINSYSRNDKKVKVKVAQSCPTPCNPCGIFQAQILEWVSYPFSKGSSQPRDRTRSPALQADSLPAEPPAQPPGKPKNENHHAMNSCFIPNL